MWFYFLFFEHARQTDALSLLSVEKMLLLCCKCVCRTVCCFCIYCLIDNNCLKLIMKTKIFFSAFMRFFFSSFFSVFAYKHCGLTICSIIIVNLFGQFDTYSPWWLLHVVARGEARLPCSFMAQPVLNAIVYGCTVRISLENVQKADLWYTFDFVKPLFSVVVVGISFLVCLGCGDMGWFFFCISVFFLFAVVMFLKN